MLLLGLIACATTRPVAPPTVSQATPGLRGELVTDGAVEQRLSDGTDGADLVLFYGGEQQGSLAPCGCPDRPRGGLPRMATYLEALYTTQPETRSVILNGGRWLEDAVGLDGQPRADVPVRNQWMLQGLAELGADALNVSIHDVSGLAMMTGNDKPALPMVSANISGRGITPFVVVERAGLRVGITGITGEGSATVSSSEHTLSEPYDAARKAIDDLDGQADVIVLLSFEATATAKRLAKAGSVDVVIDTGAHRTFDPPFRVGNAVWVRSHFQSLRLGELRLGIEEGIVTWATDRKIDMDDTLPDQTELANLAKQALEDIRAIEIQLYGRAVR